MKSRFALGRTLRHARRIHQILVVLVRYGFEDVVQETGLDRILERGKKLLGLVRPDHELKRLPTQVRLRKAMEELGSTFVKMGQVLSTRPDLIPVEWAEEFRLLQDEVPPVAFEEIRKQLEVEFPQGVDELFESIEPAALAAGSIAQVHRATLKTGQDIVIKVLRPGIEELIDSDMEILRILAEIVEDHFSNLGYSPTEVVREFTIELNREVDLTREARSTDRMRDAFADDENVSFPKVYWEATTTRVLALEEIHGVRLSQLEPGQISDEELLKVVEHGANAVFRQCLEIGFFHADPHPGNMFVLPGGRICFIDCGMVGHIEPRMAENLADLIHGVITADLDRVIEVAITMTDSDPELANDRGVRADVWEFISRFQNTTLDRLNMAEVLQDFFEKLRRHHLRVPSNIVFLIKAVTTIQGVGERLVPDFNFVAYSRPYVERLVRRRYGFRALRQRFQGTLLGYAEIFTQLPINIRSMIFDLRHRQFKLNLEHRGLDKLTNELEHASGNIAHALIVAALIMGSSVLILAASVMNGHRVLEGFAIVGYAIATVMAVTRFVSSRFRSG